MEAYWTVPENNCYGQSGESGQTGGTGQGQQVVSTPAQPTSTPVQPGPTMSAVPVVVNVNLPPVLAGPSPTPVWSFQPPPVYQAPTIVNVNPPIVQMGPMPSRSVVVGSY